MSPLLADTGTISAKSYSFRYVSMAGSNSSFFTISILLITRMTGVFTFFSWSRMCRSPAPINVEGSTSQSTTSTSLSDRSATWTIYSPSLFFALWMPGVSTKTIWPSSVVSTVWIRFLVVCGLLDVIAIFCPISRFIRVDFPTFGLPISVAKPDLKLSFMSNTSVWDVVKLNFTTSRFTVFSHLAQCLYFHEHISVLFDLVFASDDAQGLFRQDRPQHVRQGTDIRLVRVQDLVPFGADHFF